MVSRSAIIPLRQLPRPVSRGAILFSRNDISASRVESLVKVSVGVLSGLVSESRSPILLY